MSSNDKISTLPPNVVRGTKEILAGTFAGIVGTFFGHPLDLVKVRLQTQRHLYKNAFDCLVKVAQTEGVAKGLYRGIVPPLISLTFLNSLAFGSFAEFKHLFEDLQTKYGNTKSEEFRQRYQSFFAGGFTGAIAGFFSTPFELVKIRVQLDNVTEKRYRGSFHCARLLVKENGLKILYTGYTINFIREVTFCSVYFGLYEHLKYHFNKFGKETLQSQNTSGISIIAAGGLSGVSGILKKNIYEIGWMASFPFDCIKANIQGQPSNNHPRKKIWSATKEIWETRGIRGFYSGIGPSVTRAFIVSSTRFSAYEFALSVMNKFLETKT